MCLRLCVGKRVLLITLRTDLVSNKSLSKHSLACSFDRWREKRKSVSSSRVSKYSRISVSNRSFACKKNNWKKFLQWVMRGETTFNHFGLRLSAPHSRFSLCYDYFDTFTAIRKSQYLYARKWNLNSCCEPRKIALYDFAWPSQAFNASEISRMNLSANSIPHFLSLQMFSLITCVTILALL